MSGLKAKLKGLEFNPTLLVGFLIALVMVCGGGYTLLNFAFFGTPDSGPGLTVRPGRK